MNRTGMDKLLGDKFTLGADASAAAGPVGRTANAQTDVRMSAEILAWSRARGLFAGIALKGATLRPDAKENEQLYGRALNNREILMGNVQTPAAGRPLVAALDRYSNRQNEGGAERTGH
jgi:lipid-binding SYLF domain-containing protein